MLKLNILFVFSAQTNQCSSDYTSDAEVCCVVWRQHVSIYCK